MTKEEAIEQINKDIWSFRSMSEFHNDRDVILAAVKIDGFNLRFASDELINDFEIVQAAVRQNGKAIQYASDELKNNREIAIEALKNNSEAISYIGKDLGFQDEEFYKLWVDSRLKTKQHELFDKKECKKEEIKELYKTYKCDIDNLIDESLKLSKEFNVTHTEMLLILQLLELRKQGEDK